MFLYYILLFMLPMPDHPLWARTVAGPITGIKLVGLLCLLFAVAYVFTKGYFPSVLRVKTARWYLIFFIVSLLSYVAHDGIKAFDIGILPNLLAVLSLFIVTLVLVNSVQRLKKVVLVSTAAVTVGSLYVIRQWLTYHTVYAGFRSWGGAAGDPNYYAITVVIWLPVMFYWLIHQRSSFERLFLLGCIGITIVAFAMAASRGGFLGLMACMLFFVGRSKKRVRNLILACLIMAPLFLIPGASPAGRLFHPDRSDSESSQSREELWTAGMHEFENHPIFGVGWGHFHPKVIKNGVLIKLKFHVAHNTYIDLAAQLGLTGLIPFLLMLYAGFRACGSVVRKTMNTGPPDLHQTAFGLQAGLLGYAVATFFLSTWWQQVFWLAVFLAAAMVLVERSSARTPLRADAIQPKEASWNQLQSTR